MQLTGWRWSNLPVPKIHVSALVLSVYLHRRYPWNLPITGRLWRLLGAAVICPAGVLIARCVHRVGRTSLVRPDMLVTDGPYAARRHPMYVAWTLGYLGTVLVIQTTWLLIALPVVLFVTHYTVLQEEAALIDRFGDEYRSYANRVPRYLSIG